MLLFCIKLWLKNINNILIHYCKKELQRLLLRTFKDDFEPSLKPTLLKVKNFNDDFVKNHLRKG